MYMLCSVGRKRTSASVKVYEKSFLIDGCNGALLFSDLFIIFYFKVFFKFSSCSFCRISCWRSKNRSWLSSMKSGECWLRRGQPSKWTIKSALKRCRGRALKMSRLASLYPWYRTETAFIAEYSNQISYVESKSNQLCWIKEWVKELYGTPLKVGVCWCCY